MCLTLNQLSGLVLYQDSIFGYYFIFMVLIKTLETASMRHEIPLETAAPCRFINLSTFDTQNQLFPF
jgi:hypothetical protein